MANGLFVSIGRFVFGKLLPKGMILPVLRGPLRGTRFILGAGAGEGGGARVFFGMVEPQQTKMFLNIVQPGHVVFDVGANVGYYTALSSKLAGPSGAVFAFEPFPRNIAYLWSHVQLNHLTNVHIVPAACSDRTSVALFRVGDNCALGHLENGQNHRGELLANTTIVSTVTIDDLVNHTGILPDLIKVDVEGAELAVLTGARELLLARKSTLLLSVHSVELRKTCLDFLRRMNYEIGPLDSVSLDGATEFVAR